MLALLLAVNLLSYGLMAQADIAGLSDPSMAGLLENEVGSWGAGFISAGLVISLLGALIAWVLLAVEILRLPALDNVLPKTFAKENTHGAPVSALWLTNLCVQAMLLWTLVNENTYTDLIYLATSLILLPYLWSAAFQVKLAVTGETYADGHGRTRDLLVGGVALGYAVWLVYAGGWEYVLVAGLFYLVGTALFVWARVENHKPVFTTVEKVLVAVVAATSVVAVIGTGPRVRVGLATTEGSGPGIRSGPLSSPGIAEALDIPLAVPLPEMVHQGGDSSGPTPALLIGRGAIRQALGTWCCYLAVLRATI